MTKNPHWKEGVDDQGRRYNERIDDGEREWALDKVIADRIVELSKNHTYRALAMVCAGQECQMTGETLLRLAYWTLGIEW